MLLLVRIGVNYARNDSNMKRYTDLFVFVIRSQHFQIPSCNAIQYVHTCRWDWTRCILLRDSVHGIGWTRLGSRSVKRGKRYRLLEKRTGEDVTSRGHTHKAFDTSLYSCPDNSVWNTTIAWIGRSAKYQIYPASAKIEQRTTFPNVYEPKTTQP